MAKKATTAEIDTLTTGAVSADVIKEEVKKAQGDAPKKGYLERMQADDQLAQSTPATPYMQLLSNQGKLFISVEQGKKVGFQNLPSSAWKPQTAILGGVEVEGYATNHLRAVVVFKDNVWDVDENRYNNFVHLIPLTTDNEWLTKEPLRLKLKGGSVACGTWYSQVDNPKDESWLKGVFDCFKKIYGNMGGKMPFQSSIILDLKSKAELKGTGKNKSTAVVFYDVVVPTLDLLENGTLDAYADPDEKALILGFQKVLADAAAERRENRKLNADRAKAQADAEAATASEAESCGRRHDDEVGGDDLPY
jgi:hypothetical protein